MRSIKVIKRRSESRILSKQFQRREKVKSDRNREEWTIGEITKGRRTQQELLYLDQLPFRSYLQIAQRRRLLILMIGKEEQTQTRTLPTLYSCSRSDTCPFSSLSFGFDSNAIARD